MFLKLFHPPIIGLHLFPKNGVFNFGHFLVKLQASDAVQSLHVEVSLPEEAHAIKNHRRSDVDLKK